MLGVTGTIRLSCLDSRSRRVRWNYLRAFACGKKTSVLPTSGGLRATKKRTQSVGIASAFFVMHSGKNLSVLPRGPAV